MKLPTVFPHCLRCCAVALLLSSDARAADRQVIIGGQLLLQAPNAQIQINGAKVRIQGGGAFTFGNSDEEPAEKSAPDPAGSQLVELADGTHLHGTMASLDSTRQEVAWTRPDIAGSLTFPMPQVRRITLGGTGPAEMNAHATVKFTGGDWIAADVASMQGDKVVLRVPGGGSLTAERSQIEWIFFSQGAAPECYDGPTSFAGWQTGGNWSYRDGALRATSAGTVGRTFTALPDRVEYLLALEQDETQAFTILLHANNVVQRGFSEGYIQLMLRGSELRLWAQDGNEMHTEQVDLAQALRAPGELGSGFKTDGKKMLQLRIFEDYPAGRLAIFVNGRKAVDWKIGHGKPGGNRGGFSFQPMVWSANAEVAITRFRVTPWDGLLPANDAPIDFVAKTDRISLSSAEVKDGTVESFAGDKLKLRTSAGTVEIPRSKISLVRFGKAKAAADEDVPVARLRLAHRGEFDASAISFRDGKLLVRTAFTAELSLPSAAVHDVEFLRTPWRASQPADALVFKNGDRLGGVLGGASSGGKVQWRLAKADAPRDVETANLSGVLFADRARDAGARSEVLARFRNGDFLGGGFVTLDREQLVLDTAQAGQVRIPRKHVKTLYFGDGGQPPVFDGISEHNAWMRAPAAAKTGTRQLLRPLVATKPWNYFDGTYSFAQLDIDDAEQTSGAWPTLGRNFDDLSDRIEMTFDVSAQNAASYFSLQFCTDKSSGGYVLQFQPQGVYFYDTRMNRARGMLQQQQFQFAEKLAIAARERHIRLLCDRTSGRLTIIVDGVILGQVGNKGSEIPRNLGTGIYLSPQPGSATAFSNIWIAPWNGQLPGKLPAIAAKLPDTVVLANGDETNGDVGMATPMIVKLETEIGAMELPVERLTMVEFGPVPPSAAQGPIRVNLAGSGRLTLKSYRVENETLICESEVAGELKLPLAVLQELVLAPKPIR